MNSKPEAWRAVPGFEGVHEASTLGRVRSLERISMARGFPVRVGGKIVSQWLRKDGYTMVNLSLGGIRQKLALTHRVVAKTFLANPASRPHVNHVDGIRGNNAVSNLEWVTSLENARHAVDVLGHHRGERSSRAKLTEADVLAIRAARIGGAKYRELAAIYSVTLAAIENILHRRTWKHI